MKYRVEEAYWTELDWREVETFASKEKAELLVRHMLFLGADSVRVRIVEVPE